ncbi:MAG: hypothetical protein IJO39_11570 [Clostridia bacterium]|nr:hypothetical protein [Clostridia bacterium]
MSDLKNILKDIGYFGVGAAAVILEAGGKAVKCLVRKGAKIIEENQDTVDEMKQKAKEAGEKIKEAVQDLNKKDEAPEVETPEADEPTADEPAVDEPVVDEPIADEPVTPDVIYRTEESVPEDAEDEPKPEETING